MAGIIGTGDVQRWAKGGHSAVGKVLACPVVEGETHDAIGIWAALGKLLQTCIPGFPWLGVGVGYLVGVHVVRDEATNIKVLVIGLTLSEVVV